MPRLSAARTCLAALTNLEDEGSTSYRCAPGAHPLLADPPAGAFVAIAHADRPTLEGACARLSADSPMDLEYDVRTPDGRARRIRDRARVSRPRGGGAAVVHGSWTDVTRRAQADSLLSAVVETLPSAFILKRADGVWIKVNQEAARLHGRPASELEGRRDTDLFPATEAGRHDREDGEALACDAPLVVDEPMTMAHGEEIWVSKRKQGLSTRDGARHVAVHFTDITAKRRATLAAESWRALLDAVIRAVPNPMFVKDEVGRWVSINDPGARFLGGTVAEFLGRTAEEVYPAAVAEKVLREDHDAMTGSEARTIEGPVTGIDGRVRWGVKSKCATTLPDGRRLLLTSMVDLTQRRQAEATLAEYAELLQTLFQLSPDGLAAFDLDGRLTAVNGAFEQLCRGITAQVGIADADTLLSRLRDQTDDPAPAWLEPLRGQLGCDGAVGAGPARACAGSRAPREATLLRLARPEPRVFSALTQATGSDGAAHILMLRDVTREAELDELRNRFMATAAHELRTPLASIMGFSELLLHRQVSDEQRANALGIVHRQANLLRELLNELLDLSRLDSRGAVDLRLEHFDVNALVRDLASDARGSATKRHAIELDVPAASCPVYGDRARIAQVLGNLVSNAIKYSPEGGRVTVSIRETAREGVEGVGMVVADEGIGMDAETLRRAFERFYRAETTGRIPGTGLGLAIVREILMLHGGDILLESQPGRGTTARVWLPRAAAPIARAA